MLLFLNIKMLIRFAILTMLMLCVQPSKVQIKRVIYKIGTVYAFESRYGWPVEKTKVIVDISCPDPSTLIILPKNKKLREISINDCIIPKTPLADQFHQSHIDYKDLYKLRFNSTPLDTSYPTNFTSGLPIQILEMSNLANLVSPDFFTPLTKLQELTFEKMEVPALPSSKSWSLQTLILKYAYVKSWDSCGAFQHLKVEGLDKDQIPKTWPTSCDQLKTLHLESMTAEAAHHMIESINESSVANLEILIIRSCFLEQIPLHLMKSTRLVHVDFSNNFLGDVAILQFPVMKYLKVLKLSDNGRIRRGEVLIKVLPRIPALRELKLDGIGIRTNVDVLGLREPLTKLSSLEKLYLDRLLVDEDVFMHHHFTNLSYLSLTSNFKPHSFINLLKLYAFPSTGAQHLEVDLRGIATVKNVAINPDSVEDFEDVPGSKFWLTNKGYKLTVFIDSLDCDCKHAALERALRLYPHFLAMPDLRCSQGGLFRQPLRNLNCRKATVNGCKRRMTSVSNYYETVVDCSNRTKQFRWPQPQGFRGFNASGNQITSLDKAFLPDSLEWLDLRSNNISRLNGEQSARLFGNKGRRVWLAGNHIVCDCDNQPLLDALRVNQSLVQDYDLLMCDESDKPLRSVSVAELCRPRLVTMSVTVSLLAVLAMVVALILRHFWTTIRMILFAHGCCVSCLREEDLDDDRPFDAFLSFAHGDSQYVMEQLLPKLEGDPNFYRICVHYRDWVVGEWIPTQIMQSVRFSKRTIIVLSKNFIKSSWGILEFRHANSGATADGRQRLLVLVLDDVLSENLSPELQGYLDLNTYLNCDDPWFWEKLQYAMPHKDGEQRKTKKCRMNFDPRVRALAQHAYYYKGEVLSMPVIEPTDDSKEVPSRSVNVVITTE